MKGAAMTWQVAIQDAFHPVPLFQKPTLSTIRIPTAAAVQPCNIYSAGHHILFKCFHFLSVTFVTTFFR